MAAERPRILCIHPNNEVGGSDIALVRLIEMFESEKGQAATLKRIADGQEQMIALLSSTENNGQTDGESRMRLRSIDVQLLRILEEMSAGRQETVADLKSDLAAMSAAIRQLGRTTTGRS